MRSRATVLFLAMATVSGVGCTSANDNWICRYTCTTPPDNGTVYVTEDNRDSALADCAASDGAAACTSGFNCVCVLGGPGAPADGGG